MVTWSVASGAGAYSKGAGTARSVRLAIAIDLILGEVVLGLVGAGALLVDLHQHVVEKAGGAEPEALRRHPRLPERLPEHDQVRDRLLGRAHPARRLEPDGAAGLAVEVADRLHHHQADRQRGRRLDLARSEERRVGP